MNYTVHFLTTLARVWILQLVEVLLEGEILRHYVGDLLPDAQDHCATWMYLTVQLITKELFEQGI